MAMKLLAFWREVVPETGQLKRNFNHELHESHESKSQGSDIRAIRVIAPWLFSRTLIPRGSWAISIRISPSRARKKYALLQTPVFVEEFILDRTLDPAIAEFGLDEVRNDRPDLWFRPLLAGRFRGCLIFGSSGSTNEVAARAGGP
jgi:hypothetical protein